MNTSLIEHYTAHKTWLGDERSTSEIAASHKGLLAILAVLDSYDLTERV